MPPARSFRICRPRQPSSAPPPRPTVDVEFTVGPWLNRVAQHGPCRTIQGLDSARRGFRTYTRRNARRKWKCVTCERPTTASGCTYCGPLCGACAKTQFIPFEGGADPGANTWVPEAATRRKSFHVYGQFFSPLCYSTVANPFVHHPRQGPCGELWSRRCGGMTLYVAPRWRMRCTHCELRKRTTALCSKCGPVCRDCSAARAEAVADPARSCRPGIPGETEFVEHTLLDPRTGARNATSFFCPSSEARYPHVL